jgi:hypothetical protein
MSFRSIVQHCLIVVAALTSILSVAVLLHSGDFGSALPLLVSSSLAAVSAGILDAVGQST